MKAISTLLLSLLVCFSVQAELLGLVDGRSARLSQQSTLSTDLGVTWYTPQLQWVSARINVKPTNGLLAYVDVAQMQGSKLPVNPNRESNFIGTGFGGGLLINLPKWFNRYDLAFKLAYHSAVLDESATKRLTAIDNAVSITNQSSAALEQSQWSSDVMVSPLDPVFENGVSWYATAGFVSTSARLKMASPVDGANQFINYRTKRGVVLGAGFVKPVRRGQWYMGLKWLTGEPLVGVGFRYNLR